MFKGHGNHYLTPSQPLPKQFLFDGFLLAILFVILAIGLTMVASASVDISEHLFHSPFHYFWRQLLYLLLAIVVSSFLFFVSIEQLQKNAHKIFIVGLVLLVLVLIPGIGRHINGSARWIGVGPLGLQVSEFIKLAAVIFFARYLLEHRQSINNNWFEFIKPLVLMAIVGLLLLAEPDFGAFVVIVLTTLMVMFLLGVRLKYFVVLVLAVLILFAIIAISSPYRLQRLTTFLNPWQYQYQSGYQLTQSLIAFGRGHWFGVGLGNSVQKLFYLPEAHTDFLFAIITEELGLLGAGIIIFFYILLVGRMFYIAWQAQLADRSYSALLVFGFAFWLAIQVIVNIGVNAGVLPTKGLTLPFMSYGGSSLLINMIAMAFTLRADYETRLANLGLRDISELHPGGTANDTH